MTSGPEVWPWAWSLLSAKPKAGETKSVVSADLESLLDYFHGALVADLKPQWQVVDKAGPGVLVVRITLTDLKPTQVTDSLIGTAAP